MAFSLISFSQGGRTNVGSLANKSSLTPGAPSDHHVVRPNRQPAPVFPEVGSESVEVHLGKGYEPLKQDHDDAAENFRAALKVDPTLVMCARFPLATGLSNCAASPKRATNWKRFAARWTSDQHLLLLRQAGLGGAEL
jgi:hypothetical protein